MILETEAAHMPFGKIFTIFFGAWAGVLVVLYFAVGFLTRKSGKKAHP